ncbi:type IV secretion system protein VirB10 [Roseateles sp. LYH14W]|uniref:Type IV secretion system protein VirB10 n=1 Tax=Pelomonas parva TaxID=3299032 RepID=A0ABW7FA21_9BURK
MTAGAHDAAPGGHPDGNSRQGDTLAPLPGEFGIPNVAAPKKAALSTKGLLAVALLIVSLVAVSAFAIKRYSTIRSNPDAQGRKQTRDIPTAAATEPRKLEMPAQQASATKTTPELKVPAITPTEEELAEPLGIRHTGDGRQGGKDAKASLPEDAPVMLVSVRPNARQPSEPAHRQTTQNAQNTESTPNEPVDDGTDSTDPITATSRNLQAYQRQLQGLLDNLTKTAEFSTQGSSAADPPSAMLGLPMGRGAVDAGHPPPPGLFGGQLLGTSAPKVHAGMLGTRSLILPKGTAFTCALKTRIISAASGLVGCQVLRNLYSEDGRVLLIERGSHLDGEYRITSVRPGTVRIPVLWTRLRTPLGVTVDLDSPATGMLGESGIDGHVDRRWSERVGAAMLLSLIDDTVKLVIQNQSNDRQGDTFVLPSTTSNTSKLAEKVLDSTINIPPLIYQNQGAIVGIYVARDVDFSSVYELVPTAGNAPDR